MGAPTKVVDMGEVKRWMEQERPYRWMVEQYRTKYNVETTISMWAGIRRRLGLETRIVRDDLLIPWGVKEEHRHSHAVAMLRAEARRRAGKRLTKDVALMLEAFKRERTKDGTVVHYDPDTQDGWWYVPRREGVDMDLIREPKRRTGRRDGITE